MNYGVHLGLVTGTTLVVEELRLEWLPLSTSATSYVPPVARFHIQHFRDIGATTLGWVTTGTELMSIVFNKKLASSWLQVSIIK